MKRTPEEERIFRALAQIETPEADLSAALRRTEEPRRIRPVRPLAAAAVLCALLTIGAAAVGFSGASFVWAVGSSHTKAFGFMAYTDAMAARCFSTLERMSTALSFKWDSFNASMAASVLSRISRADRP